MLPNADDPLPANVLPPFAALRAFEAVFRTGGIRKAAASLNINHSVVSRHIRHLEQWVGAPLFTANGSKLALTEVGARYHARVSISLIELAQATAEAMGHKRNGQLRLWCVPGFSIQWLSAQLAQFALEYPEFQIELKPTDSPPNLLAHEADADIRYIRDESVAAPGSKGLKQFELARPEVIAVASPEVAKRLSLNGTLEGLLTGPLLHEENRDEWRNWLGLNGLDVSEPSGQLHWHAHLSIDAAKRGRGVALGNRFLIEEDLTNGLLVEVRISGATPFPLGSYVLTAREDGWSAPALAALRRFLSARAKPA